MCKKEEQIFENHVRHDIQGNMSKTKNEFKPTQLFKTENSFFNGLALVAVCMCVRCVIASGSETVELCMQYLLAFRIGIYFEYDWKLQFEEEILSLCRLFSVQFIRRVLVIESK